MEWGMARENLDLAEVKMTVLQEEKCRLLERLEVLEIQLKKSPAENTHIWAFRTNKQAETYERTIRNQLTEEVTALKSQVGSLKKEIILDQDAIRNMAQEQNRKLKKRAANLEKQLSKRRKGTKSGT